MLILLLIVLFGGSFFFFANLHPHRTGAITSALFFGPVSYTHLRAHET